MNNVTLENIDEIIEKCNFKPSSRKLLISINQIKTDNNIELVSDEQMDIDEWQYVISAGRNAEYKPKDLVYLDLNKFVKREPNPNDRYSFIETISMHTVKVNGKIFALIDDNKIAGMLEEVEFPEIKA